MEEQLEALRLAAGAAEERCAALGAQVAALVKGGEADRVEARVARDEIRRVRKDLTREREAHEALIAELAQAKVRAGRSSTCLLMPPSYIVPGLALTQRCSLNVWPACSLVKFDGNVC